ncbi:MAG: hypothetical protein EA353_00745 [Puniceicoccaceae bacterium]|nr:MAG: hypothetical protein EA353_00745 [Puniceicoccaceae bacterium]
MGIFSKYLQPSWALVRARPSIHGRIAQILCCFLCIGLLPTQLTASGTIPLRGANGVMVDFIGIREAHPNGLFAMVTREQGEIFVEWPAFDLRDMETRHPSLYQQYSNLRGGTQSVTLNMGLYEGLRTKEDLEAELKTKIAREITLNVPPMTGFFDMSGFNSGYSSRNWRSVFSSWDRRSSNYLREYERLLADFFGLTPNSANRSIWTYSINGRTEYTVYTEVRPPQTSVRKPISIFFYQFADRNARGNSMLVNYLRNNREVHKAITIILDEHLEILENNMLMGEAHEISVLKATISDARRHLHGILESTTLSADLHRDFDRYLRTWNLGDF